MIDAAGDLWRLGRLYRVESAILSGETMVQADAPTAIMESTPRRIFEEPNSDVPFDPRQELREPPGLRASESLAGTFRDNADLLGLSRMRRRS